MRRRHTVCATDTCTQGGNEPCNILLACDLRAEEAFKVGLAGACCESVVRYYTGGGTSVTTAVTDQDRVTFILTPGNTHTHPL